eukprot:scaffold1172_cov247-Pinguiococcus_pyrenoidosus.AAC.4
MPKPRAKAPTLAWAKPRYLACAYCWELRPPSNDTAYSSDIYNSVFPLGIANFSSFHPQVFNTSKTSSDASESSQPQLC